MGQLLRSPLWLVALVALVAFPLIVTNPYYVHLATVIAIFAILIIGLDIVVGYTGEVSLAHAALFGIGSYTVGVLVFKAKVGILIYTALGRRTSTSKVSARAMLVSAAAAAMRSAAACSSFGSIPRSRASRTSISGLSEMKLFISQGRSFLT